jgi:hypothetical protein
LIRRIAREVVATKSLDGHDRARRTTSAESDLIAAEPVTSG